MGEAATTQGLRHIASQEAPVWVMAAGRCFHLVSIRRQQMRDMPPRATACCCCLTCVGIGRHLPDCAKPATAGVFQLGAMLWPAAKLCGQSFPQAQCLRRLAPCPSRKPCISPAWRGQVSSRLARSQQNRRLARIQQNRRLAQTRQNRRLARTQQNHRLARTQQNRRLAQIQQNHGVMDKFHAFFETLRPNGQISCSPLYFLLK